MKKFLIFLFISTILTTGLFAVDQVQAGKVGNTIDSPVITVRPILIGGDRNVGVENPFAGIWGFYLKIIIGALGGSLMLLRFATELVGAVIYEGEDSSSKVRQVIIRFLVHVGVAMFGFSAIYFIVGF